MNTLKTFNNNVMDGFEKTIHSIKLNPVVENPFECTVDTKILQLALSRAFDDASTLGREVYSVQPPITLIGDVPIPFRVFVGHGYGFREMKFGYSVFLMVNIAIEKAFIPPLIAQAVIDFRFDIKEIEGVPVVIDSGAAIRNMEFLRGMPITTVNEITKVVQDEIAKHAVISASGISERAKDIIATHLKRKNDPDFKPQQIPHDCNLDE